MLYAGFIRGLCRGVAALRRAGGDKIFTVWVWFLALRACSSLSGAVADHPVHCGTETGRQARQKVVGGIQHDFVPYSTHEQQATIYQ